MVSSILGALAVVDCRHAMQVRRLTLILLRVHAVSVVLLLCLWCWGCGHNAGCVISALQALPFGVAAVAMQVRRLTATAQCVAGILCAY
jgi:hypothetical protein